MKIPILFLSLWIWTLTAYAQITIRKIYYQGDSLIGQVKYGNNAPEAKLIIKPSVGDTVYTLYFHNTGYYKDASLGALTDRLKSSEITLVFEGGKKTLDTLFNILNSFFERKNRNNPNYKVLLTLGETEVTLNSTLEDLVYKVQFNVPHGYYNFTKRDLIRLFRRNESEKE